jgi:hypothetical protein
MDSDFDYVNCLADARNYASCRAGVVELADTQVLEACAARRAGSSPAPGIIMTTD